MSAAAPVPPQTAPVTKKYESPLLTWKDPIASGKVFGGSIVALLLIKYVSLVPLFFKLAFIGLFISAGAEYIGKIVTGSGFASRFRPNACLIRPYAEKHLPTAAPAIVSVTSKLQGVVFSENVESTLKAAAASFGLYKITSWFSLYTLAFTSVVLAFTVPFVYSNYQKEIHEAADKYYSLSKNQASKYKDLAHEHAKPYITQAQTKIQPYSKKISGYLPKNRTAGSTVGASPVPTKPATTVPESVPVASTTGSSVHTTTALPKVPNLEPVNAAAVSAADLKASIKKDKATLENAF